MKLAITIPITLILLTAGYIYLIWYYAHSTEMPGMGGYGRFSRNRLLYIAFGIVATGALISLFTLLYKLDTVTQVKLLTLVTVLLPAAVVDLREHRIPNKLLLAGLIARVLILGVEYIIDYKEAWGTTKDALLGAAIIGAFFLIIMLIFKNSIGMGDVKITALIGLYQGVWGMVNSLFFSLVVSFFTAIVLLITKKKSKKDTIAFGPSLLLGTVIAMGLSGM